MFLAVPLEMPCMLAQALVPGVLVGITIPLDTLAMEHLLQITRHYRL
jgi:hypothetical protein